MRRTPVMVASLAALALSPARSGGEELLALPGAGAIARVQRLEADGSQTNLLVELGVSVTPRAVLPSRDGTDLLIFGCDGAPGGRTCFSGPAYYFRVGRTGTASDPLGPYQGVLLDRVVPPGTPAVAGRVDASWAGPRHVALIVGDNRVYFYDTAGGGAGLLSAAAPDGWAPTPATVTLPPSYFTQFIAGTPDRVYVSDGSSRLQIINRGVAAPVECLINGGNSSDFVTALTALPDGRAVAALNNSRVALIPTGCGGGTGASSAGNDTPTPFEDLGGLSVAGGRVFGSGGTLGVSSVLPSWSAGANLLDQRSEAYGIGPGGVFEPFGQVAATVISGTPTLVVAGEGGYRLRTFNGSGYPSVGSISTEAAAPSAVAAPSFAVDRRLVEMRSAQNLLELYGAAGKTLRVFPGSCRQTVVSEVREVMGGYQLSQACMAPGDCASGVCTNQQCGPALAAGASTPGRYLAPGSGRALLGITQSGTGEDCQLVLACDPSTPACAQGGGGALLRVRGGARALALVLDRSGSMNLQVGVSDPMAPPTDPGREIRAAALQYALGVFTDAVSAVPTSARAGSLFTVVPFDDRSRSDILPATGAWTGDDLVTAANLMQVQMRLAPRGSTNIRGALRTAAERMTSDAAFAMVQDRSVLLLTDGLHNRVGNAVENDDATHSDPVGNLTSIVPYLQEVSWSPAARPRVNRLYAVGLAQSSQHPALLDLVRQTNSPASAAALPPGYINYADAKRDLSAGNQLAQFFTKVLWDYLGATEFLDPIDTFTARGETRTYDIDTQGSVELAVLVAWQGTAASLRPVVTLTVNGQAVACNGNSSNTITCYINTLRQPGAARLTVTKGRESPLIPQQILVEAAGRSLAQMVPQQPKKVHRTGENIVFQVRLQERGLPLAQGATVTGKLVRPSGALGTVLSRAQVSAADIKKELERVSDQSAAAAKFSLLPRAQVPGHEVTDITLRDDGKSGDGQAGDGVFGALVPANLPGIYELVARGTFNSRYLGQDIVREASLGTQVVVTFNLDKSLQKIESFTTASKEKRGSITLQLTPQDDRGNLLGPGASDTITFKQRGRVLPAAFTEPEALDGSYRVVVSEVDAQGPVEISGIGVAGQLVLWRDPTKSPLVEPEPPMCKDGCCCDLRPHSGAGGAGRAALVAGLLFLALALRRRRRPYAS